MSLEFSGGLELLLEKPKEPKMQIALEAGKTMRELVKLVRASLIRSRPELYATPEGEVRPGILVLINDTDWELEGGLEYVVEDKDLIVFISTLHGG